MKFKGFYSVFKVVLLCFVILFISYQFALDPKLIGWVIISLGLLCMVILIASGTKLKSTWPDLVFGAIDNGVLAVMAIFGGEMAGVMGAVIGGVVGNAVTDGIAGIFEGMIAEKLPQDFNQRTILSSAIGKMAGCLLAAGLVLVTAEMLIKF
ncbi:MAG: hypothetical protein PHC70_01875 [Patescibacteria group bacterium]|nr:hypothetical protein [Patescibacteria group bacterium]